jgi:hypothetical protein
MVLSARRVLLVETDVYLRNTTQKVSEAAAS